jgi:hypothetical protein
MIVDNAKGEIKRHSITGRPLNIFNKFYTDKNPTGKIQKGMDSLIFGKTNKSIAMVEKAFRVVSEISRQYKLDNKGFTNKRISIFNKLLIWSCLNEGETLQIKYIPMFSSKDMIKLVVEDIEKLELVEVYDGFKINIDDKFRTISRAIKPSKKLMKLMDNLK